MLFQSLSKYSETLFNLKFSEIVKWVIEAIMEREQNE